MRLKTLLVVLFGAVGLLTTPAFSPAQVQHRTSPRHVLCSAGYVDAIIGGQHKCLRAGEFCSTQYEPDYEKYGFTCVSGRLQHSGSPSPQPPPSPPPPPSPSPPPAPPPPPSVEAPSHTVPLLRRVRSSGCQVRGPLPDRRCSPGAIYTDATLEMICTPGYSSKVRNVPESEKKAVYAEYGIPRTHYGRPYEVDHIVSLELGGSNDIANLYPEAASDPSPGFHVKDKLENKLHALICSHQMKLATTQRAIASNWVVLYRSVYGVSP